MKNVEKHMCLGCNFVFSISQFKREWPDIPDIAQRVSPGEPAPSGECPKCGALAHPLKQEETPATKTENCLQDMRCPECGYSDKFEIIASSTFVVMDEGTDGHDDVEWENHSPCRCPDCGYSATVGDFTLKEYRVTWRHELFLEAYSDSDARAMWENIDLSNLDKERKGSGIICDEASVEFGVIRVCF